MADANGAGRLLVFDFEVQASVPARASLIDSWSGMPCRSQCRECGGWQQGGYQIDDVCPLALILLPRYQCQNPRQGWPNIKFLPKFKYKKPKFAESNSALFDLILQCSKCVGGVLGKVLHLGQQEICIRLSNLGVAPHRLAAAFQALLVDSLLFGGWLKRDQIAHRKCTGG
eukprot:784967-Rhodomonas_salina.15